MKKSFPKFSDQRLEAILKKMQTLCDQGFYRDLAWEVGTNIKGEKKSIFTGFAGKSEIRANKNSLWRIFSMTKPLVSIVALKLIEEGKLRLFDHVGRFLPDLKNSKILKIIDNKEQYISSNTPMTIFNLLTHTSGLSYGFLPDPVAGIYRKEKVLLDASISLEEEAKKIASFPLLFDPGSSWD